MRVKTEAEQRVFHDTQRIVTPYKVLKASQGFSNFFNAYSKSINLAYQRTGSLFERPFHRIEVTTETYFSQLVVYIHQNPQRHALINDFRAWPYSSYRTLFSSHPTRLQRDTVLAWFGGPTQVVTAHQSSPNINMLAPILIEDE